MAKANKTQASESTVREVPGSVATDKGRLWEYTGDGYLPTGAMRMRTHIKADAITGFRYLLEDFGYHDGADGNEPHADDCRDVGCEGCSDD